jgi:hypothetical protein
MPHDKELFRVPKLTQENHERWFRQMKIQLEGKGLFYTVEQTLIEYARVATVKDNVSSIQSGLEQLKLSETNTIHLNIEKKSKYQKDRASALSYICRSLNDDDEALVDEYDTAQQIWKYLKSKYTRVSAVTANAYMTKIQNFRFQPEGQPEMTIIEAWDKLKEYHGTVGAADQAAKSAYQDTALFLILTRSLPVDYKGVIDTLDIQVSVTIEDKLNISKPRNYDFTMFQNKPVSLEVRNTIVYIIDRQTSA